MVFTTQMWIFDPGNYQFANEIFILNLWMKNEAFFRTIDYNLQMNQVFLQILLMQ